MRRRNESAQRIARRRRGRHPPLDRTGKRIAIALRDHGPGVPDAIAERIFDPFFSTKGVGKGLGLGLSISYNIVKDFGGTLTVERHPDGGAVVTIELDADELPEMNEAAE